MKTKLSTIVFALLCLTQAMAEDYEYVPFVREGVKWVYGCENPFWEDILDMPEMLHYYSFEMMEDVVINDKYYKPVRLTHYLDKDGKEKEVEDFIPVYLREEEKVVYAILPDGILHPQCPVGIGSYIGMPSSLPMMTTDEEFILYDFNDPDSLYQSIHTPGTEYLESAGEDIMTLGSHRVKVHHYRSWYDEDELIIEGVGYDGNAGMPLFYFESFITGLQVGYGLSHVIENGEIIYKGRWYESDNLVGIDEVVSEQSRRAWDGNYFNMMGQPVGKDMPTTPGIYIHQGGKIVVR